MPFKQPTIAPDSLPIWTKLQQLADDTKNRQLISFFDETPDRYQQLKFAAAGITADLSRHFLDEEITASLLELAEDMQLPTAISRLQQGAIVNPTEQRPALHCALRSNNTATEQEQLASQGREQMHKLYLQITSGQWCGSTGEKITDIVNIGIGGSDLGPRMLTEALTPYHNQQINLHFVTNVDPCDLEGTLANLNPASTLFIVTSKSWTTLETLSNAETAKHWLTNHLGSEIAPHFIGITAQPDKCAAFGIAPDHILPMWDWVGGRFSLWSAVGISIALATSFETYEKLLAGAQALDQHFFSTPLNRNLPALLALLEIWYVNFWGCGNVALLPYDHSLRLLPDYLQQLTMESNGKSTSLDGKPVYYQTAPVLWGSAGTIGQHSFHQLLHQGTQLIPVDFILPIHSHSQNQDKHLHMVANCLAQAETLMEGKSAIAIQEELLNQGLSPQQASYLAAHKSMPANRPSTIISVDKLTPENLGALLALYEHKTYCQSVIWNINAFDQWGVELGKKASSNIYQAMRQQDNCVSNPATLAAIAELTRNNKG